MRVKSIAQVIVVCSLFGGCSGPFPADKIDPAGNLTRKDYLALRERGAKTEGLETGTPDTTLSPPIPKLPAPIKPPIPALEEDLPVKKVSLAVSESMSLREVLLELARQGDVNIEIDPRISGGVIFTAKKQPFDKVLARICSLAGLRYTVEDDFIRIEIDEPYQKTYPLDYLSLTRRATSEVTIATNVFDVDVGTGAGGLGGASASTGRSGSSGNENNSVAKISGAADADFWNEVEKSLPQVLATTKSSRPMTTGGSPPLPANDMQQSNFSLDKQAGLVTIFGNDKQHRAVQNYLRKLQDKASSQVLIEGRIIEVELSDEFQSGVNWSALFKNTPALVANFGAPGAGAAMTTASSGLFSAALDSKDFSGIMNLVRTFGATRVLSSPRLTVLNNQTAVLKVARNEVYFLTNAQFPTTTNAAGVVVSGTPVFSSTPRTVPVGLVMTVQPAIDKTTGRVTLTLRPTISRVVDRVNDPSIGLNAAYSGNTSVAQSKVPVLAVREMDSVLQLQSGEVAVMGGLMQDSSENQDQGVPPFDSMPLIGNLAKSRDNNGKTSELVILLRATILHNVAPDTADQDLYIKYHKDPRPLPLPN